MQTEASVASTPTEEKLATKKEKPAPKKEKKAEKKKKSNPPKLHEKIDALLDTNHQIVAGLNTLATAVSALADRNQSIASAPADVTIKKEVPSPHMLDETRPTEYIPPSWRKIVDETLSPEFGIRIKEFDNTTDFMVDIIVPEKYSSLTPKEKELGVRDIRSRMISRSAGENGIRDWCKLIRSNLSKFYGAAGVGNPFSLNPIV